MNIVMWILTVIISLAFLFFGAVKVFGVPQKMYQEMKESAYDVYGLSRMEVRLIGLSELFGAVTIWLWPTPLEWLAQVGMISLMVVTAGAMFYHNRYDSVTKDGLPAIIQFVLNGVLLALTVLW